jgi:hypothetical protein
MENKWRQNTSSHKHCAAIKNNRIIARQEFCRNKISTSSKKTDFKIIVFTQNKSNYAITGAAQISIPVK